MGPPSNKKAGAQKVKQKAVFQCKVKLGPPDWNPDLVIHLCCQSESASEPVQVRVLGSCILKTAPKIHSQKDC